MSRQGSNGGSWRTTEAAPLRLIRVERQSTMERKLPTIKEDESTIGDQGSQLQNYNGISRVASFSSSSTKTIYSTKHYACN
ncbi:hypothetical protein CTI12_AA285800 [Artemisia annua]|uniref:Uncharacterized protein n=1 Tax=Artemisia annua TaxID=35608 RepID=A0A2U1KCZ0_ARTAN|nr:hypothetical protein CTI12_AA617120 [Artemisia annua]PWA67731.1 hypothetical protein CTI12_AA285800 [Artemisia annua]